MFVYWGTRKCKVFTRTGKCELKTKVNPPVKLLMGTSWDISSWSAPAAPVSKGKPPLHTQEHSSLYILPLREPSQPQTALHKPKSANPWRSLVFWFCLGETQASQGTDIIPQGTNLQAEGCPRSSVHRMGLPAFSFVGLDCTSWWMLLLLPGCGFTCSASSDVSKTRI